MRQPLALLCQRRAHVGGFYFSDSGGIVPCYEAEGDNGYATMAECDAARSQYLGKEAKGSAQTILFLGLGALVGGFLGYLAFGNMLAVTGGAVVGAIPIGLMLDLAINGFQPGDMM